MVLQLYQVSPCYAHIEQGYMPDPVAEMEYRILLDFQPEKVEVRNKLGMLLYRQKKYKEAEKEFRAVLKRDPANFNALDALGLVLIKNKQFKKAAEFFGKAVIIKPDDPLVFYHLGLVYLEGGDLNEAMHSYERALVNAGRLPDSSKLSPKIEQIKKSLAELKGRLKLKQTPPVEQK